MVEKRKRKAGGEGHMREYYQKGGEESGLRVEIQGKKFEKVMEARLELWRNQKKTQGG